MFDEYYYILSPPSSDEQIYYDDSMPPIYDDYMDESGFGRVSTQGNAPTILESVESYCNNYESGFGEVMTLFNDESTILEEVSIDYDNKVAIYDDYGDDMHWYASVLNKRFLTPFRDGIWNRRQVSVCDRVSFPHDPEIVGDRPSWDTG